MVTLGCTPSLLHLALRLIDCLAQLFLQRFEVAPLLLIDPLMQTLIDASGVVQDFGLLAHDLVELTLGALHDALLLAKRHRLGKPLCTLERRQHLIQ